MAKYHFTLDQKKKKKKHELQRFKGKKKSHIIDTVQLV